MLRFSFLVIFFALFCSSFAQFFDGRNCFGVGASYSSISSKSFDSKGRIGWNTCFGGRMETLHDFDVMIYLNLGTMGATLQGRELDGMNLNPEPVEYKFYFMNLMNNCLISYPVIDPTLRLNAGFCFGSKWFLQKQKDEGIFYLGDSDDPYENIDAGAMFNEIWVDFGLTGGISAGTEDFEIAISYTQFLNNMCKPVNSSTLNYQARNGVLELKFFYFIDLML
ncbi:MAG: hypothetical protein A2W93_02095 [Bacteroidetes bacterium GWF2_43_63]|nr:MAG: hypothetical protein A2W94_09980 [Bacteroidetes bacterium GWE2_42_42]OFY55857.1 MAG: hypothetical protein A2W93_02095 [Bacteroidetes bacterium GWF2_43_63]HBG71222.1 hypothetical protein [Bacteroidales bacterium]HCB60557.1 hypothetical protein [Bacteroidales bacterium]HCY22486.1 hypothetical protein [Bacteroidales bacterium]